MLLSVVGGDLDPLTGLPQLRYQRANPVFAESLVLLVMIHPARQLDDGRRLEGEFMHRLAQVIASQATVVGGRAFAAMGEILVSGVAEIKAATALATLLQALVVGHGHNGITASVGIAYGDSPPADPRLVMLAHQAASSARANGGGLAAFHFDGAWTIAGAWAEEDGALGFGAIRPSPVDAAGK